MRPTSVRTRMKSIRPSSTSSVFSSFSLLHRKTAASSHARLLFTGPLRATGLLRERQIVKNTLADTPSGYVQDPRVLPSRMVDYRVNNETKGVEMSRISQAVVGALELEKELQGRSELAYDGYTTPLVQWCKSVLLSRANEETLVTKEELKDIVSVLREEALRVQALVGELVPPPLTLEYIVRCRFANEKLSSENTSSRGSSSHPSSSGRSYQTQMNLDGSERFCFTCSSSSSHSRKAQERQEKEAAAALEKELEETIEALEKGRLPLSFMRKGTELAASDEHRLETKEEEKILVTPTDVHHILFLLCLAYRRLQRFEEAEKIGLRLLHPFSISPELLRTVHGGERQAETKKQNDIDKWSESDQFLLRITTEGSVRNVDAMECLLEMYCGLGTPGKIKSLAQFLSRAHASKKVREKEEAALLSLERAMLEDEPNAGPLPVAPLHRRSPASPQEMLLAVLSDLVTESAAEKCAVIGEGATSRFLLEALGPILTSLASSSYPELPLQLPPRVLEDEKAAAQEGERAAGLLIESLYRAMEDQFMVAVAASAFTLNPKASSPTSSQENRQKFGEANIDEFLDRVRQSRLAAVRKMFRSEEDQHKSPEEAPDMPEKETVDALQRRQRALGEQLNFTLVVSFWKTALQCEWFKLVRGAEHYHFFTLFRLYEALRSMGRIHESYRIFERLERSFGAELKSMTPDTVAGSSSSSSPPLPLHLEGSGAFPSAAHQNAYRFSFFMHLSDRVAELSALRRTSTSSDGKNTAVARIVEAMERYPTAPEPWVLLALVLYQEEKLLDALVAARRAVTINPLHLNGVYTLASLFQLVPGCETRAARLLDRYRLLCLMDDEGAKHEDRQSTIEEILTLSEIPTAASSETAEADEKALGEGEEEMLGLDKALKEYYERLQVSTKYSMDIDVAPREFVSPPVKAPSLDTTLTKERPSLMNRPYSELGEREDE